MSYLTNPYRYVAGGVDVTYDFCNNTVLPVWTTASPASIDTTACQLETTVFNNTVAELAYTDTFTNLSDGNWIFDVDFNFNSASTSNNYMGIIGLSDYADVRGGQGSGDAYLMMWNTSTKRVAFGTNDGGSSRSYGGSTQIAYNLTKGTNYYTRSERTDPTTVENAIYSSAGNRNAETSALGSLTMTIPATIDSLDRFVAFYGEDNSASGSSYQEIYAVKLTGT